MSDNFIKVSFDKLGMDASNAAGGYLRDAVRAIDDEFGKGFAKKNPELVAAFMRTAAEEYKSAMFVVGLQNLGEILDNPLARIMSNL